MNRSKMLTVILHLVLIGFLLIIQLGCSKPPNSAKSTPEIDSNKEKAAAIIAAEENYKKFLNDGIDKVLQTQYKEAIPSLIQARKLNPKDGEVHFWLFQAYKNTEKKASKQSNAYIAARNVILLKPGRDKEEEAQEYIDSIKAPPKQVYAQPKQPPVQKQITSQPPPVQQQPPSLSGESSNNANYPQWSKDSASKEYQKKLDGWDKEQQRKEAEVKAYQAEEQRKEEIARQQRLEEQKQRREAAQRAMEATMGQQRLMQQQSQWEEEQRQKKRPQPTQTVRIIH